MKGAIDVMSQVDSTCGVWHGLEFRAVLSGHSPTLLDAVSVFQGASLSFSALSHSLKIMLLFAD
jgi:hypothetical protein